MLPIATATLPVVLEVALNGATSPARNPNVPRTPSEVAADAIACLDAGASVVHSHSDDPFATPADAASRYAEAYRPVLTARPAAICYPTVGVGDGFEARFGHLDVLAADGLIRCGLCDPGPVLLGWPDERGAPARDGFAYVNTYADAEDSLDQCRRLALGPSVAIYEPGFLATFLAYWRVGLVPPGAMVKLYFGGPQGYFGRGTGVTFGLPPTPTALDAYLEVLGLSGCTLPWSVAVMGGDLLATPVARAALERGGHLHVGIEDHAGPMTPTNAELVAAAVELAQEVGRPIADPATAAALLELPAVRQQGAPTS